MSFEHIKQQYGVPAQFGRRVLVYGKPGIIAADRGHYIGINFDADKPGVIRNAHPTAEVEYLDMGKIRQMTAGQRRYQDYLDVSDCFDGFLSFLRYRAWQKSEASA